MSAKPTVPPKQRCDFCQQVKAEFMYARRDMTAPSGFSPTYRICAECTRGANCAFAQTTHFYSKG